MVAYRKAQCPAAEAALSERSLLEIVGDSEIETTHNNEVNCDSICLTLLYGATMVL